MTSMVDMIKMAEENLKELEEKKKENAKKLAELEQDKENIEKNINMFKKVLKDLNKTKNEEVQAVMVDVKVAPIKKRKLPVHKTEVLAIDEKNEVIAKYNSCKEAAKDLGIDYSTINWRIKNVPAERQIKKNGYALKYA